jgi:hypothetical protein
VGFGMAWDILFFDLIVATIVCLTVAYCSFVRFSVSKFYLTINKKQKE